jgi:hypothetical protein
LLTIQKSNLSTRINEGNSLHLNLLKIKHDEIDCTYMFILFVQGNKQTKELGVPEISACPMWSLQALMSPGALILGMPCSESFIVHKAPAMYAPYTFHICKNFCTH